MKRLKKPKKVRSYKRVAKTGAKRVKRAIARKRKVFTIPEPIKRSVRMLKAIAAITHAAA